MRFERHDPIRLFDGPAPGADDGPDRRRQFDSPHFDTTAVVNVTHPTITPVVPEEPNGTAIVIAPGGGYHGLSIDSEGFDVAAWLAARGVTGFVLEYRTVPGGDDPIAEMMDDVVAGRFDDIEQRMRHAGETALADAQAAMRRVRADAGDLGLVDGRAGFIGFSAGGNLGIRLAFDDADDARPDFHAWIYPAVRDLAVDEPAADIGPLFLAVANDDELGLAADAVRLHDVWRRQGLPVEFHAFAGGGHGFGMRERNTTSDAWIELFGGWLRAEGLC